MDQEKVVNQLFELSKQIYTKARRTANELSINESLTLATLVQKNVIFQGISDKLQTLITKIDEYDSNNHKKNK